MANVIQRICKRTGTLHPSYFLLHKGKLDHIKIVLSRDLTAGELFLYPKNEDLVSLTKTISLYSNEGKLDCARDVFDKMTYRDSVTCNVMIKEYVRHGRTKDARELFDEMPERNTVSWNSMIMAYAKERKSHIALKFFIVMPDQDKDVISWTSVLSGLARDSHITDAWQIFKQLSEPNSVSWSAIISGFQQNGLASETLMLFKEMLAVGRSPTSHSFTSVLTAAADLAAFSNGQQLYCQILKRGFHGNNLVVNSAISMFMKSGSLGSARNLFYSMLQPDMFTWNAMISGYGQNGYAMEAILVFHQMQKARFQPDRISFLGVLQGCSHCGLIKEGLLYFDSMHKDFGVPREPAHFVCMVDILARAGFLKEAAVMIFKMPFEPTAIFWRTLLNGCRIFKDFKLGVFAADQVLKLEPDNAATCLMVAEMYIAVGRWAEVERMRRWMSEKDARRELSYSWIEIKGKAHLFTTRDETHHESNSIYMVLELLEDVLAEYVG